MMVANLNRNVLAEELANHLADVVWKGKDADSRPPLESVRDLGRAIVYQLNTYARLEGPRRPSAKEIAEALSAGIEEAIRKG